MIITGKIPGFALTSVKLKVTFFLIKENANPIHKTSIFKIIKGTWKIFDLNDIKEGGKKRQIKDEAFFKKKRFKGTTFQFICPLNVRQYFFFFYKKL